MLSKKKRKGLDEIEKNIQALKKDVKQNADDTEFVYTNYTFDVLSQGYVEEVFDKNQRCTR